MAALLLAAGPSPAAARDSFFFPRSYVPRSYYAPVEPRSRYDDGYVDPLSRRTAEQLRRAPKPPAAKGPLLVAVSLAHQRLTVYDDGVPIAQSRISSGNASNPTPTGLFAVIQKQRWHRSNLYSAAPMPFMQRITWSGVALHAGQLPGYPASHGCIRLPDDFAIRLWRTTSVGARVVISQNDMVPAPISHVRLFKLPPPAPASAPMAQADTSPVQPVSSVSAAPAGAVATPAPAAAAVAAPVAPAPATTTGEAPAKAETRVALAGNPETSADAPVAPTPVERPLRPGPVSVFVSRKEQKVYVRKGFEPLFDMPVKIQNADQPLGTHLFVAMSPQEGSDEPRWMVVSPPAKESGVVHAVKRERSAGKHARKQAGEITSAPAPQSTAAAAAALDRIQLPEEAVQRITALMSVGAALTITDEGLGPETGKETDFSVVTSPIQPSKRPSSERYDRYERYDRSERYQFYPPYRRWF